MDGQLTKIVIYTLKSRINNLEAKSSHPNIKQKAGILCQLSGPEPVLVSRTTEGELRSPHKKQQWDTTASVFNKNSPSVSPK